MYDLIQKAQPNRVKWTPEVEAAFQDLRKAISQRHLEQEVSYATVECLAIKWVMGRLKYYLLETELTLITDQAPLKWMCIQKDLNSRVTSWFLELQDYMFWVVHWASCLHLSAEALLDSCK